MPSTALTRSACVCNRQFPVADLSLAGIWGLGFHFAFPGQILNFLRSRPYQSLLIRVSRIALWASPQAKLFFLETGFREIHRVPIARTLHPWRRFQPFPVSVLLQVALSIRDSVPAVSF